MAKTYDIKREGRKVVSVDVVDLTALPDAIMSVVQLYGAGDYFAVSRETGSEVVRVYVEWLEED